MIQKILGKSDESVVNKALAARYKRGGTNVSLLGKVACKISTQLYSVKEENVLFGTETTPTRQLPPQQLPPQQLPPQQLPPDNSHRNSSHRNNSHRNNSHPTTPTATSPTS
ncbi:hypothetical protein DdX_19351 [Ditylenchus destructor]|uniref:Uncharacterized protein n=1 Tax=Ditylenchus destructor TaxID=166010 RepID=A0AAD4QU91_9BILA|nr:hypothetical protein DdX_19351 [Ditylenchus destructor]